MAQFIYRVWLVASRLELGMNFERPANITLGALGGHQRQHRHEVEGIGRFHASSRISSPYHRRII
jgi:hypothetical protein